ncbi:hypothetical protein EL06_24475 [Salmonella enterica subsp. diarizonae]|uniref:Uncharacterized protein n=1 Tax=Salmonella diarizonae TaxID=59204 RepID=A0A6C8Y6E0_SALDZ|nr:hypothetical protein [Salmonella enterica subsp. diarizonae]
MGVECYITRAEFLADNEDAQITADEWLNYINDDDELSGNTINGDYHALWPGHSLYEELWPGWSTGNIYTKWPDTGLYRKMLGIARPLNARVMEDDGTIYSDDSQWEYESSTNS